jgi:hypothetical protein
MKLPAILLLAAAALAQTPDGDPLPDEWGYRPADGATVEVNPPALTWVHAKGAATYIVEWAPNARFEGATAVRDIPWSVYTHHAAMKPGGYWWRYRIVDAQGKESAWSRARRFQVPATATVFPQPTIEELRRAIPKARPRLFVRPEDLPRLRDWAKSEGRRQYDRLIARADEIAAAAPTPEPTVRANARDPKTNQFWWPNREQAIRALQEAEILSFAWLLTGDKKYAGPAREFTLKLAAWDPDGPTNWALNCEAAKPMLHRLARAYDWAWPLFSDGERARIRAVMLRRAEDAWKSGEVRLGAGHLNQPYNSHGNRTWHKLAENAIATLDETPESEMYLRYAVAKFFAAYPAWSDEDGGWHEGLSYFAGYLSKAAWWMHIAPQALGIDAFKKPFFAHFGDYPMYSAPPGSPDLGIADLSHRTVGPNWSFFHFYAGATGDPHWTWWAREWKIPQESGEPVLAFLWGSRKEPEPKPPLDLPPSKVFRGTGIAILNTTLRAAADNVQLRFKASPMGRWSHGHDPHNSFTLNAYGAQLLVNNVYRDLYGTPFHRDWVWSTRAQNAVLVDGQGQKAHSADLGGRIVRWDFHDGFDYLLGDATASYEGRLTRAFRHVFFAKPDVIVIADELRAPKPSAFQWMLHAQVPFGVEEPAQRLTVERDAGGVLVDYVADGALKFRQWTGYDPEPDYRYLNSINSPGIPPQWHVEAASTAPRTEAWTFTVLRVYKPGRKPDAAVGIERGPNKVAIRARGTSGDVDFVIEPRQGSLGEVRRGGLSWRIARD